MCVLLKKNFYLIQKRGRKRKFKKRMRRWRFMKYISKIQNIKIHNIQLYRRNSVINTKLLQLSYYSTLKRFFTQAFS